MIFNKVSENQAEININDEIGFWGISHQDFSNQLKGVGDSDIVLNIASYGGVVSDAMAIYNELKSHKGRVVANIYGDSASSATFIAMAADEIRMSDNVLFLIHNVWGGVTGNADELRQQAEIMDKVNDNIIDVYKKKTGLRKSQIKKLMDNEEWWTAKEAKSNGFIDKIVEPSDILNRSEAMIMNCATDEMKEALLSKVNQLNNNKSNLMTEENKSWFESKFEEVTNLFNKKEEAPKIEEQPKEETISKEEVSKMLNSVKEEIESSKEEAAKELASKDEEIKNLQAELEKLNNKQTKAEGSTNSPEAEVVVEEESVFMNKTLNRIKNKFIG